MSKENDICMSTIGQWF